ncbi:hypothetical protein P9Y58_33760, partial [Bacillus cereus]|nr:hypothetical protein [Bacillus cereus]
KKKIKILKKKKQIKKNKKIQKIIKNKHICLKKKTNKIKIDTQKYKKQTLTTNTKNHKNQEKKK